VRPRPATDGIRLEKKIRECVWVDAGECEHMRGENVW